MTQERQSQERESMAGGHRDPTRPFRPVGLAILVISDTRTLDTDESGRILADRARAAGHNIVSRTVVPDDIDRIVAAYRALIADDAVECILSTGGTGFAARDVTPEAVARVADRTIPGFGELFRMLSYRTIGTATIASRALGCIAGGTYLFALPGSKGAVKDAWDGILVHQLDSRTRPCNLVDLLPALAAPGKDCADGKGG